ncbi:helix-turn-helix domain-containing protein [Sorangium sp. So ce542]|uniref:helix-turn-helix domain-containing protein n=1 Tax=Sorangium sp. So ce542 TaxID=3133316 RepID=UPI003F5ED422
MRAIDGDAPRVLRLRACVGGKTSWEIGVNLAMSERTVNFHLHNASAKLGVSNRQHAVAKAMLLGLLRSPPVRSDS